MNNEKEVVQRALTSPLWGGKATELNYGDRIFLKTELSINLPSHWSRYDSDKSTVLYVANEFELKPRLLIWGEPNIERVEHIWWSSMRSNPAWYVLFLDEAADSYEQVLMSLLLDVDNRKTQENHSKGIYEVVYKEQGLG